MCVVSPRETESVKVELDSKIGELHRLFILLKTQTEAQLKSHANDK